MQIMMQSLYRADGKTYTNVPTWDGGDFHGGKYPWNRVLKPGQDLQRELTPDCL